jgi:hypothetical protein
MASRGPFSDFSWMVISGCGGDSIIAQNSLKIRRVVSKHTEIIHRFTGAAQRSAKPFGRPTQKASWGPFYELFWMVINGGGGDSISAQNSLKTHRVVSTFTELIPRLLRKGIMEIVLVILENYSVNFQLL